MVHTFLKVGAQQLDGYGQECFLARDERGTEVLIGASLTGIVIRQGNGENMSSKKSSAFDFEFFLFFRNQHSIFQME